MIKLQGIHKYFNKGRQNELHVLNDISLTLPERGMVAVFGRSGCGKTTLLNVIGGLDSFAEGALSVDGADIRENPDLIRNRSMGYIFQNYNLHKERTCHDNVADALRLCGMRDPEEITRRVRAALRVVDMEQFGGRTPDTLSGGQQQRIAIARAIVKNPRIILADEPTGNLDEANTLMIMDLLKQISRDHLVLLVTHEANLVDHYCDTVIELKDGRVESIRENESADGMVARNKNHIYLGELPRTDLSNPSVRVEYYGEAPADPITLRVVNKDGKIYVRVETPDARLLDDSAEIRLKEGVFEESPAAEAASRVIDMSDLPTLEGSDFGRLFRFGGSVKSGYEANFKKQKRGKRFLRNCLCLFAAVAVLATAVFGTVFGDIATVRDSYSHNTFYVYTPDGTVSDKLQAAYASGEYGMDALYLTTSAPSGDKSAKFITGYFETFSTATYDESFRSNAVYLPHSLAAGAEVLAGSAEGLKPTDLLITKKLADALLKTSSVGYIAGYADLIGLVSNDVTVDGASSRIAGVVKGEEATVYVSNAYLEEQALSHLRNVKLGVDYGREVKEGEVILAIRNRDEATQYPAVGSTVKIHGKELKVANVLERPESFEIWVEQYVPDASMDPYEYFRKQAKAEFTPDKPLEEWQTPEDWINLRTDALYQEQLYPRLEKICSYLDEYMALWLLFEEDTSYASNYYGAGIKELKYTRYSYGSEYYRARLFHDAYGRYPTHNQEDMELLQKIPDLYTVLQPYYEGTSGKLAESEYDFLSDPVSFLMNPADYASLAYRYGESSPLLLANKSYDMDYKYEDVMIGGGSVVMDSVSSSGDSTLPHLWTVIHTSNPEATDAFLNAEFADLTPPSEASPALLTPNDLYEKQMDKNGSAIFTGLVTVAILMALLAVCMYFIMRSALMSRIKEVGIWRAIGVSRKNLCFRFLIETLTLTTLTVFPGFLVSSSAVKMLLSGSSLMSGMLFYPLWLAGVVLALLYFLCALFGTLPILSLMRKTPSAILAKYDI